MIQIYDSTLGITLTFQGKIKEIAKKMNYNEVTSIYGRRFSESVRKVIDLETTIEFLDELSYKKLQDIFMFSNGELEIHNIDTGKMYRGYIIGGDSLSLDEFEDFDNKILYYKGGLLLNKR